MAGEDGIAGEEGEHTSSRPYTSCMYSASIDAVRVCEVGEEGGGPGDIGVWREGVGGWEGEICVRKPA